MEEILEKVSALYMKYGIKSITMDDVAKELCISKKTLYQHFTDKDDLVSKVVNYMLVQNDCDLSLLKNPEYNAIDVLLVISKKLNEIFKNINPATSYDLKKYHPKVWKEFVTSRRQHIFEHISENILKGIEQGLYREDFNINIIASLYVARMEMGMDKDLEMIEEYDFEEIFNTIFIYHIRGIANAKGIKYLEDKIKNHL